MPLERMTLEECEAIFEASADAILVIDHDGDVLYRNPACRALRPAMQQQLQRCRSDQIPVVSGLRIAHIGLRCGQVLMAHRYVDGLANRQHEQVLSELLQAMKQGAGNIFQATAIAVARALGWRWISVTRFNGPMVDVIAHCADGTVSDSFSFELAGSPCEEMARTRRFTLFSDVAKAFPANQALQQMGAKTYAGLIYRDNDNLPVGHIMAIHDQRDVDYRHTEEVLTLATLALSSHLMLDRATQQLESALEESRTDALTCLYNRKLFDETLTATVQRFQRGGADACLAIIDVDRFKQYNDTHGHVAGDRLLRLLATELTKLGRESDFAYRIGGDEFAMIFADANRHIITRVARQFMAALQRLSLLLERPVAASIGFSMLSECEGQDDWYDRADLDMYRHKPAL